VIHYFQGNTMQIRGEGTSCPPLRLFLSTKKSNQVVNLDNFGMRTFLFLQLVLSVAK
jgi:hypothetical protein